MKEIRQSWHMNPSLVLYAAVENASPMIMIKSTRIWWSVYQVPIEVKPSRKIFFACKRIITAARAKTGKPMYKLLCEEILAAYSGQWAAVKKKEEVQKMAEANRAFAYMAKYVR
jgi:small subunit ribosomal protein S7